MQFLAYLISSVKFTIMWNIFPFFYIKSVHVALQALFLTQLILQSLADMLREFLRSWYRSNKHINGQNITISFHFLWVGYTWSFPNFGWVFASLCQAHFQFWQQTMPKTVKKPVYPVHTVFTANGACKMLCT